MDNKYFLEHFGIPGMRWGKRGTGNHESLNTKRLKSAVKAQGKDVLNLEKSGDKVGSKAVSEVAARTMEKLKKSQERDASKNKKFEDKSSEDHKQKVALKKKPLNQMSNAELKVLTNRLQLEKQYKDLTKADVSAGQKFVSDLLVNAAKETAKNQLAKYMGEGVTVLSAVIGKRKK